MQLSRRRFLATVSAAALCIALNASSAIAATTVADVWMETPDVLAFIVYDDLPLMGNIVTLSVADVGAYDTVLSRTNPRSGLTENCNVIGPDKKALRFSDKVPANFCDQINLRVVGNYLINNGLSVSAVYHRDEANSAVQLIQSGQQLSEGQRRTFYLQLSAAPTPGVTYTIANSTAGLTSFNFTFNDKATRAGGIKVNFAGHKRSDTFKKAYLCSRLPGAPNSGVVDFAGTYGQTTFEIIDSTGWVWFRGPITLRRAWNQLEVNDGYSAAGIDVVDIAQSWAFTAVTKGNPTTITVPSHGFSNGDKARCLGVSGMTQLEGVGATGGAGLWVAPTVTVVDANTITINVNSTAFSNLTTGTYSAALGGVENRIYKCFNTNRSGTNVYECDYSAFLCPQFGTYYVRIPGYGVSDPILIDDAAWAIAGAKHHEGTYNQRLGIALSSSSYYARGIALQDGVNGCTNYWSDLPALCASETTARIIPSGGLTVPSGFGAYAPDGVFAGGGLIQSITWAANVATVTTATAHNLTSGQLGQIFGASPAGYNTAAQTTFTVTGAATFTYPVTTNPGSSPASTPGQFMTGWVTSARYTGGRSGHQDAGDNDDMAVDHLPSWNTLAQVFYELAPECRFMPFNVQLSSQVLDPVLFAGTDNLPPLFHEMAWHFETYRAQQGTNPKGGAGSVPGGMGIGHFSAQVPNYPEPISYYRGTIAGGSLSSQTVMGYVYASDAVTNMIAGYSFAKFSQIAYGYGLALLGDTYKQAALDAIAWADDIYKNSAARDAYYDGQLNLTQRMGWTTTQRNSFFVTHNSRVLAAKRNAYGAMYRLLGSVAGQTVYGAFIDGVYTASASVQAAGTNYAVNDTITLTNGTVLVVNTISGSAVATISILFSAENAAAPANPVAQASTSGSGTGFAATLVCSPQYTSMNQGLGGFDYFKTPGSKVANNTYMLGHAYDSLSTITDYCLSTQTCFNALIQSNNTSGGTKLLSVGSMLQAQMTMVFQNGIAASAGTVYMKTLQAGMAFAMGANQPGKSFTTNFGPRSVQQMLHEDAFKLGYPGGVCPGQTIYGYFAWVSFLGGNNYGLGSGTDGPTNWIASNVSGIAEASPNFGSKKMWTPFRHAESYWEWSPEQRGLVFPCEFDISGCSLANTALCLYLHGWDGNSAQQAGNQRFGWGGR